MILCRLGGLHLGPEKTYKKFLCMSETVPTHREVGLITTVCFSIILEIFTNDTKETYGLIMMSYSKSMSYDVVKYFEEKCFKYVRNLGYKIILTE